MIRKVWRNGSSKYSPRCKSRLVSNFFCCKTSHFYLIMRYFILRFDGDPEKLALYIVALAKKVEDDLSSRQRCIEDLEVFLEAQTNGFVDQLFDALVNKTYMGGATASSTHQTENPNPRTSSAPKESANTSRGYQRTSRDHYDTGGGGGGGGSSYYHRRSTETGSSSRARSRSRSRSGGRRRSGRGTRGRRSRSRGNRDSSSSSSSSGLSPVKRRSRSRSLNSRSRSRSRSPAYRSSYRNEPHTRSGNYVKYQFRLDKLNQL